MSASPSLARRVVAESLGTTLLIVVGTGCVMTNAIAPGALGLTGIALCWGFLVTTLVATFGGVSGAHFNPAVTVALALTGRHPVRELPAYVAAQCAGAIAASALLSVVLGDVAHLGATAPAIATPAALLVEFWLSFLLMATVLGATADERWAGGGAAIAIGMAVALDVLMGGPLTGASMNPARSLGPAVVAGQWQAHWIYWVAPIGGMTAAASLTTWLRGR